MRPYIIKYLHTSTKYDQTHGVCHVSILSDTQIIDLAKKGMITPFSDKQISSNGRDKLISYGTSSYGYDARISDEFRLFTNNKRIVDPKNFNQDACTDIQTDVLIMPPHSFALARTLERFKIPRNVLVMCLGKSTYARCGLIVNVTPLEPEWEGYVTIEISNTTDLRAKVYANEGICQFLFFEGSSICNTSYADKNGKYQNQTGIVNPRV